MIPPSSRPAVPIPPTRACHSGFWNADDIDWPVSKGLVDCDIDDTRSDGTAGAGRYIALVMCVSIRTTDLDIAFS